MIGSIKEDIVKKLRQEKENGAVIIIWTCRSGAFLNKMKEFLDKNNIPYDYINENYPGLDFITSRKIYADEYWDDRATKIS